MTACRLCGNTELYRKKDFPHWLGLTILTAACLIFFVAQGCYWPVVGWTVLLGSALFDGLLYLWVKDVVVCYRCGAHYRNLPSGLTHDPFDLGIAERYRQEQLRRRQLQAESQGQRLPEA
jgi:hypothetical protein